RRRGHPFSFADLPAETTEVLNEVARRALDCLATFDHNRRPALAWLMGIAKNVLRERVKWVARQRGRVVAESSCPQDQWQEILGRLRPAPPPGPGGRPVGRALERLKEGPRKILRLRYYQDRSYHEIATDLGISEGAARAQVCRALRALRRGIEELEKGHVP